MFERAEKLALSALKKVVLGAGIATATLGLHRGRGEPPVAGVADVVATGLEKVADLVAPNGRAPSATTDTSDLMTGEQRQAFAQSLGASVEAWERIQAFIELSQNSQDPGSQRYFLGQAIKTAREIGKKVAEDPDRYPESNKYSFLAGVAVLEKALEQKEADQISP